MRTRLAIGLTAVTALGPSLSSPTLGAPEPVAKVKFTKIKHRGNVAGVPGAKIRFTILKRKGELWSIADPRVLDLPLSCTDGTTYMIDKLQFGGAFLDSKRFTFKTSGSLYPPDPPSEGELSYRFRGKLRKKAKRASGKIHFHIELFGAGKPDCDSGAREWRTKARR